MYILLDITVIKSLANSTFQCPHADWTGKHMDTANTEKYKYKFNCSVVI